MYRLIVESLLGLRLETDKLYIEPCMPSDWESFKIHYRYQGNNLPDYSDSIKYRHTKLTLIVDGTECQDKFIRLINDNQEHLAEVKIYREK